MWRPGAVAALALGCSVDDPRAPTPAIRIDPPTASLAGYQPLLLDLSEVRIAAGDVVEVTIGGVRAWDIAPDGDDLRLRDQGAPSAGPQEVVLVTRDGASHRFPGALTYDPPLDPVFDRVVAFGASLTQGVQGGVPLQHGVLHSPPHLLARQLGASLPLPLIVDPLFPPIGWDDLGPPPSCAVPDVVRHVASGALDVLAHLVDPETGEIDFRRARVDPELVPANVAVGDTELHSMIYGPPDDPAELFVVKMVYAPEVGFLDGVSTSQLELVEAAAPTMVLTTDPYGNDVVQAILFGESGFDMDELTPVDEVRADLEVLLERLAATGAEVFLANLPRPSVLPVTAEKRAAVIDAAREEAEGRGEDPDAAAAAAAAEVDAKIGEIEAVAAAHDANLAEIAARYDTVHVVDFHRAVQDLERDGLDVGAEHLTPRKLDGLLSTDGVHFGDVGYGLVAQLFVEAIRSELGVHVPDVDLEALLADDPYGPPAARAAGFDPEACAR
jgi:lysophospholipase L1-like esterase